jgi:hypothetical protein
MSAAAFWAVVSAADGARASDPPSHPEGPDPASAFIVGAVTQTAGLVIGGSMVASGEGFGPTPKAGFIVLQSSFILTPIFAHGVVDEWGRGLWFAAVPAAALGGTLTLFSVAPGAVTDQDLGEVRVLWSMVTADMLSSTVGVIDATLVRSRTVHVTPSPVGMGAGITGVF